MPVCLSSFYIVWCRQHGNSNNTELQLQLVLSLLVRHVFFQTPSHFSKTNFGSDKCNKFFLQSFIKKTASTAARVWCNNLAELQLISNIFSLKGDARKQQFSPSDLIWPFQPCAKPPVCIYTFLSASLFSLMRVNQQSDMQQQIQRLIFNQVDIALEQLKIEANYL